MDKIKIAITGRVASVVALPEVVADNAEYEVDFALDPREGWDMALPITALFVRRDGSYTPRIMDAGKTSCTMPPQTGTNIVYVGLTQDDMRTTTPATIKVHRSIRTVAHDPLPAPSEDVYAQILAAYARIKILSGKGAPTSATQGKVNQLYRDEDTQRLYICTATDGGYTWAAVSGGSVDVDATLTKAGYAADAKAAGDAIGKKLDKAQGVENAGMILGVGEDGNVVPGDPSNLPGLVSYSMSQELTYEQQALAKENIGAGTLRDVYYWRANGTPENPNGVLTCAINGDTCICGGKGDSLPDGMQAPVLVIYGSIDRGYRDATAFDGSNATWTFTVNLRDYSYSTPIKKSGVPTPATAQVGQIVKVKAVDESGNITETEAVDMPSGGDLPLLTEIATYDMTEMTFPAVIVMPDGWREYIVELFAIANGEKTIRINNAANESGYAGRTVITAKITSHAWGARVMIRYRSITEGLYIYEAAGPTLIWDGAEKASVKSVGTDIKYIIFVDDTTDVTITQGTIKIYAR